MSEVLIREFQESDTEILSEMRVAISRHLEKWSPVKYKENIKDALDSYLKKVLSDKQDFILMAKVGENFAGYLLASKLEPYPEFDIEFFGYVKEIYAKPEFRGKGIGKKLIEEATKRFKEQGIEYLYLHCDCQNADALDFYASADFKEFEKTLVKKID